MLWIPVTLAASVSQLARNALQSGLTRSIGTLGATLVRFLYALPFAVAIYAGVLWFTGSAMPDYTAPVLRWGLLGAVVQIAATALMLKAMDLGGFALAYAYIKTEPVLLALGGWWILGDSLPLLAWAGIALATLGVVWAAMPRGVSLAVLRKESRAVLLGIAGGALFGLSSLSFRAAILEVDAPSALLAALHVMLLVQFAQTLLLGGWLWFADRKSVIATFTYWRQSIGAGFTGALATMFWFIAFALTVAANVRTLALVEMPLAALVNRRVSGKHLSAREWTGIAMVVGGILLLLRGVATG